MARSRRGTYLFAAVAGLAAAGLAAGLVAPVGAATTIRFRQTNLVSDIAGVARTTDPNLINPWGMSEPPGGPLWVSDNNAAVSTLYTGDQHGKPLAAVPLVVAIPNGAPTGQVFNPTTDFVVSAGGASGAALFIFASENGDLTGWNPMVPPGPPGSTSTMAEVGVSVPDAVYKGLAMVSTASGNFLLGANFRTGMVDVFDGHWHKVSKPGMFVDPKLPAGYAPFDVALLGGRVYVTYAVQNSAKHDDVSGPGHGFVDVFTTDGMLQKRLVSHGALNSPWGLAMAPAHWGSFGGDLLVGNFGDGRINAYDPMTGAFKGTVTNTDGNPVVVEGLWGLEFGDAAAATPRSLFFTAGIAGEAHGLLGTLVPAED
jgi:uncharacterized protein (TIGR03118 family)